MPTESPTDTAARTLSSHTSQKLAEDVSDLIKTLIEGGHLYQSARLVTTNSDEAIRTSLRELSDSATTPELDEIYAKTIAVLKSKPWTIQNPAFRRPISYSNPDSVEVELPNVVTSCGGCGVRGPMQPASACAVLEHTDTPPGQDGNPRREIYAVSFMCQTCTSHLEVFALERMGDRLRLTGRSPMERVQVPGLIPKRVRRFYSSAQIAHNSGQLLPALFMLRTLVEQYVRNDDDTGKVDQVLEAYAARLPDDFKSRFPSLKDVYGKLSEVIHRADESDKELFVSCRSDLERHFDALRLFQIDPFTSGGQDGPQTQAP